ncbi:YciI family protein [Conexibacter sp. SYSU D00693]|uniref:YciI family protein n=1 Tax=Conexibacter sp. SYSU D00693 TaxID=2812560 RepID=UPI001F11D625|nr:YciI family protein [Conexibacter sp. SYSU D00693]
MARFMLFMLPNISPEAYAEGPDVEAVEAMARYNQELLDAGVMLAGDGLHPAQDGRRVSLRDGAPVVTDGPFTEAKEVVGGYWIIQARDLDEATDWARRCPMGEGTIEVRQIFDPEDYSEAVQEAARLSHTPPDQTVER